MTTRVYLYRKLSMWKFPKKQKYHQRPAETYKFCTISKKDVQRLPIFCCEVVCVFVERCENCHLEVKMLLFLRGLKKMSPYSSSSRDLHLYNFLSDLVVLSASHLRSDWFWERLVPQITRSVWMDGQRETLISSEEPYLLLMRHDTKPTAALLKGGPSLASSFQKHKTST